MNLHITARRYDLDWLRVLAIAAVFVYHSTRFFTAEGWIVHNAVSYQWLDDISEFPKTWLMPLVFLVSGASFFFAMTRRSHEGRTRSIGSLARLGGVMADKVLRLILPLTVGIFTHAAWQVYLERLTHGQFQGSFIEFYPHYFDGLYWFGGNFAWMGLHLWYLEILFIFVLVSLPLVALLRTNLGGKGLSWLTTRLAHPWAFFLLALPLWFVSVSTSPDGPFGTDIGGWSLATYLVFFLSGIVIASDARITAVAQQIRWGYFAGALATAALGLAASVLLGDTTFGTPLHAVMMALKATCAWLSLLAIFGFAARYLTRDSKFLRCANEAVLPIYILHQSVMLTIGYFTMSWPMADLIKYAVTALATLAACVLMYEFLVRRIGVLRILFGMKLAPRAKAAPAAAPLVQGAVEV